MKSALVTGITGQDGAYLAKFLLQKGYDVYGIVRRSTAQNHTWRLDELGITKRVKLITGDVTDTGFLKRTLVEIQPNEIYHLAAQSFVGLSFNLPLATLSTNAFSTLELLEIIRNDLPSTKFYFAGSSEMYGDVDGCANEETPFNPKSPYAVSKVFGYHMARVYRESYGIYAVSGILFNHESELRGPEFVTQKIAKTASLIAKGHNVKITLGNLMAKRDWGYAPEYVEAMWMMMQRNKPTDYVIATGETHSVREFLEETFNVIEDLTGVKLDIDKHVIIDPSLYRPNDVNTLCGDYTKAKRELGWIPRTTFKELVRKMVKYNLDRIS